MTRYASEQRDGSGGGAMPPQVVGAAKTGMAGAGYKENHGAKGACVMGVVRVTSEQTAKIRALLKAQVGEEMYKSWFYSLEFDAIVGTTIHATVPVKFLQSWIQSHYSDRIVACCRVALPDVDAIEIKVRQPGAILGKDQVRAEPVGAPDDDALTAPTSRPTAPPPNVSTVAAGLPGSPLDTRLTFSSFVVGAANRMAHAAATQVAETLYSDNPGFNPLCIHSSVGLGKTHLLHAIAWEIRRRHPQAQLLYLTAERFRYDFVAALQSKDAMGFKERLRSVDILLIDDLEFLSGPQTEQEFDHVVNALLDGNRQLVVAASKAPGQIDTLSERMRSRLQKGLSVELKSQDYDLRSSILKRRVEEKRMIDPAFHVPDEVIEFLAERLTESGRELEGAASKLYAQYQWMNAPVTLELAHSMVRELAGGYDSKRIRIDDILKVVSRHYGVSRQDILSQRRHRSVVWPRQIGMYLAKQLTQRSLPEIGRRFGNRDHTTVLHAIRKIDGVLADNPRLREELEDLKRILNH